MGWNMGWGGGSWIFMGLGIMLVLGVVIVGLVGLLRSSSGSPAPSEHITAPRGQEPSAAARILDERFARGDITEAEHRQMRDVLRHG